MEDCIFCKIIKKEAQGNVLYENESFLALVPIKLVVKGHTLIIPKQHSENLLDIDNETLKNLSVFSKEIASRLLTEYGATGINLLHAAGKDAQQSVFHFHFHLIPRHPADGMDWWVKKEL